MGPSYGLGFHLTERVLLAASLCFQSWQSTEEALDVSQRAVCCAVRAPGPHARHQWARSCVGLQSAEAVALTSQGLELPCWRLVMCQALYWPWPFTAQEEVLCILHLTKQSFIKLNNLPVAIYLVISSRTIVWAYTCLTLGPMLWLHTSSIKWLLFRNVPYSSQHFWGILLAPCLRAWVWGNLSLPQTCFYL